MALHLVKLAVGSDSLETLIGFQTARGAERHGGPYLLTRNYPRRADELREGGSLYWVIAGVIQARQPIADFRPDTRLDGSPCTAIVLTGPPIPVAPRRMRAFQGWRYLSAADAPPDLGSGAADTGALPPGLRRELAALCLL